MPTWNSEQYLKFASERTQPATDLVRRVALQAPRQIVDLGCGPGNSTEVASGRWPDAQVIGIDSSPAMLTTARSTHPSWTWIAVDIATWAEIAAKDTQRFDLVFSNAALQWVPNHATLIPNLMCTVAAGGALAFQVPHSLASPLQRCARELAGAPEWRSRFQAPPVSWHVEPAEFYYDALVPLASRVDVWLTDYLHVLAGPEAIVEWHRGTGLRPFLDALADDAAREEFLAAYLAALRPHYPRRADGKVLMPFRRLFVIAYR